MTTRENSSPLLRVGIPHKVAGGLQGTPADMLLFSFCRSAWRCLPVWGGTMRRLRAQMLGNLHGGVMP